MLGKWALGQEWGCQTLKNPVMHLISSRFLAREQTFILKYYLKVGTRVELKIEDLVEKLELKVINEGGNEEQIISNVYICDLLSNVMAKGKAQTLWITIQTHQNIVAVASLLNFSAILLPEDLMLDAQALEKAKNEGLTILSSSKTAYALAGELYQLGLKE